MDWKLFGVIDMLIRIIKNVQLILCRLSFNKAVKILPGNKEERIQKILNESNNFQCQSVGKLSLIV